MKLSILIPITPERYETVQPLLDMIIGQRNENLVHMISDTDWEGIFRSAIYPEVEVCMISDNKEMTLGEKRERLYKMAKGEYSWQVDSDDLIAENSVEKILSAIYTNPDVITFEEQVWINRQRFMSNFSLRYAKWDGDGAVKLTDGFHFHRTPFYKCVIKTEIARSVPFPHIRYNEDEQWAAALKPHLKTEIHIDEELYYYIYNSQPEEHNERYGIK